MVGLHHQQSIKIIHRKVKIYTCECVFHTKLIMQFHLFTVFVYVSGINAKMGFIIVI